MTKWVAPPDPDWRDDVDQSIGYALLETEHVPGFARRGPAFREKLAEAGWQVTRIERESSLGRDTEGHLVLTLGPGAESPSRKGEREVSGPSSADWHEEGPACEPLIEHYHHKGSPRITWASRKEGWNAYDGMSPLEQRHADGDR